MEVHYGMHQESLKWLSSYLEGWIQYTVVEAANSRLREMINGVPQGGGLSPVLWQSSTNDIPEAGLRKDRGRRQEEVQEASQRLPDRGEPLSPAQQHPGNETGGEEQRSADNSEGEISRIVDSIMETDLTTKEDMDKELSRASAKTLRELEKRNGEGVTRVCKVLKAMRLKVNKSKTTYMIIATQGIHTREK